MSVTEATTTAAARLPLTFACGLYDRMLRLYTGEVQPRGIDLTFLANDEPRDIFDRMGGKLEFDASEMSSSEFISRFGTGHCPFVAIPVFASRLFRHGFIFFNRKAGIRTPKDLEGKRVGVPLYTMSAAIWIRGLLQHEYGVDLAKIRWVQGALKKPGAHGSPTVAPLLKQPDIEINRSGHSLEQAPGRRRNRCRHQLAPGRGDRIEPRHRPLVSQLSRGGEGLLPAHPHLSDHASHRHPPRCP